MKVNEDEKQSSTAKSAKGSMKRSGETLNLEGKRKRKAVNIMPPRNDQESENDPLVTCFNEDGNVVEIETKGQSTEFNSGPENDTEDEIDSDSGEETEATTGHDDTEPGSEEESDDNHNSSANVEFTDRRAEQYQGNGKVGPFTNRKDGATHSSRFDEVSDVTIKPSTNTGDEDMSKNDMKKFINYMKKQGLVIVESLKAEAVERNKLKRKSIEKGSRVVIDTSNLCNSPEFDKNSEITIYHQAVQPSSQLILKLSVLLQKTTPPRRQKQIRLRWSGMR